MLWLSGASDCQILTKCETLSWELPHQISESSWFCWETSAKTLGFFLSTNPVHINPGGYPLLGRPKLASSLGVAQWGHMPWDLHQPMSIPLLPAKVCAVPMEPSTVLQLGVSGLCFSSPGWERRDCLCIWPPWGPQFWLASCEVKIIASHTSLLLVHLPRLPWKWACCFWSTHVL